MKSFNDVINEKIAALGSSVENVDRLLNTPSYHSAKMKEVIDDVISQILEYEGEADDIRDAAVDVFKQLPGVVERTWHDMLSHRRALENEAKRWQDMSAMYSEWEEYAERSKAREEELQQEVESGEIEEPTKMAVIRRKPGTKPAISLAKHRRLTSENESGEDSEA